MTDTDAFLGERRRARRFFNRMSPLYPIVDYGCDGGWFIRFIEWIEGPNYPLFIAEDRAEELGKAGLRIDREERVSDFGSYWLCSPHPRGSAGSAMDQVCERPLLLPPFNPV
jgi:hypothetical protein